ncbi:MAG TPA: hypothetical protein VIV40_24320 [Kofleriaceae bacterium]
MRALVLVASVLIACGGNSTPQSQQPLSATWTAPSMLAKVPADSPYLVAVLDPMPDFVRKQSFGAIDKKLAEAIALLEANPTADRSALTIKERLTLAFLDELKGKDLASWGRELGFDPSGRFVLYGLSVWPVMRVSVGNEQKLREVIGRVIAKSGIPIEQHTLQGRMYWQLSKDNMTAIVSVTGGEIVAAALPTPALAQYLPIILGLQAPPHSLSDNKKLAAMIRRYHFMPTMVGYIDAQIVADILAQRAETTNTELDRPMRKAIGPVSDICRADLDRLVEVMPRVVFGYRQLDTKGMHATMVAEMPAELTASLQRLHTSVPELGEGLGQRVLARFGVAAKLDELMPLLRALTDHIRAKPFQCSWFTSLNDAAGKLAKLLDTPVPAPLLGFRGMSFVLDDISKNPEMPQGHALVVGDHAYDLLLMLLKLVGMGGVAIHPDGKPVQLPLAQLGAPASVSAFVASRVDRVSVAMGPNSARDVVRSLDQPMPKHSPLLTMAFDAKRMLEVGLIKPEDASGMRDLAMQLDVGPEGLRFEMFGTFPGP